MNYFSFSKAGREWNEDRCYVCENFGFVLDGSTCLIKQKYSNFHTDAEWFSNRWSEYLINNLSNMKVSIADIVKKGIKIIVQEFKELTNETTFKDFPSSTISIFRIRNNFLEFYVLGDSPIIVETKYGNCFEIISQDIALNDNINKEIIYDYAVKHNMDMVLARQEFPNPIMEGRENKNKFGGYFVLSDSVDAVEHALIGSMPLQLVGKVMILSDGYSQIYDVFKKLTIKELSNKINTIKDVEKFYKFLCDLQNKDKGCNKFLRTKIRDDSSIVVYKF